MKKYSVLGMQQNHGNFTKKHGDVYKQITETITTEFTVEFYKKKKRILFTTNSRRPIPPRRRHPASPGPAQRRSPSLEGAGESAGVQARQRPQAQRPR